MDLSILFFKHFVGFSPHQLLGFFILPIKGDKGDQCVKAEFALEKQYIAKSQDSVEKNTYFQMYSADLPMPLTRGGNASLCPSVDEDFDNRELGSLQNSCLLTWLSSKFHIFSSILNLLLYTTSLK